LNLQNASVVINCDLPWNPAKLEQRIARAWRKHQTRAVTVVNLVSENTIEHRMLETLANKQALADGVLDAKGDLRNIKLQSGRQMFLARLEQLTRPASRGAAQNELKPALPADRALGFAAAAHRKINGALVRCEEKYPAEGPHSVLYVVVDRDAANWRESLNSLHGEYFANGHKDPLAPVRLEVIDRATDEALQRLIETGLVARTTRATRPLWPEETGSAAAELAPEQKQKALDYRARAARKLKAARALHDAGLADEACAALLEAVPALGRALAVEQRLPEPGSLNDCLVSPLAFCWKQALPVLREAANGTAIACEPLLSALAPLVDQPRI
jgi:hypothetical protein